MVDSDPLRDLARSMLPAEATEQELMAATENLRAFVKLAREIADRKWRDDHPEA